MPESPLNIVGAYVASGGLLLSRLISSCIVSLISKAALFLGSISKTAISTLNSAKTICLGQFQQLVTLLSHGFRAPRAVTYGQIMLGTRDACQMPCVSSRAEMPGARDAVVVRAFRRECGILYTV